MAQRSPILSMVIGGGVAAGTGAAVRAFTDKDKWSSAIGLGAGVLAGLGLWLVKKTRPLAVDTIAAAVVTQAPRVIEDMMVKPSDSAQTAHIARAVAAIRGGDMASATHGLANAFGVTAVERVSAGVTAGMLGVTTAEPVNGLGQTVDLYGNSSTANTSSAFGAIPLPGVM